jgi:hypothetical protein
MFSSFSIEDFIPSATLLYKLSSSCFNTKIFDEKPEIGNKKRKEKQEKNSGIKILAWIPFLFLYPIFFAAISDNFKNSFENLLFSL